MRQGTKWWAVRDLRRWRISPSVFQLAGGRRQSLRIRVRKERWLCSSTPEIGTNTTKGSRCGTSTRPTGIASEPYQQAIVRISPLYIEVPVTEAPECNQRAGGRGGRAGWADDRRALARATPAGEGSDARCGCRRHTGCLCHRDQGHQNPRRQLPQVQHGDQGQRPGVHLGRDRRGRLAADARVGRRAARVAAVSGSRAPYRPPPRLARRWHGCGPSRRAARWTA